MKDIPSAEFRKTYPRLAEPVAVTALGRVIGHYVPVGSAIDDRFVAGLRPGEPPDRPTGPLREALGYLDAISPSGFHVEQARDVLRRALEAADDAT